MSLGRAIRVSALFTFAITAACGGLVAPGNGDGSEQTPNGGTNHPTPVGSGGTTPTEPPPAHSSGDGGVVDTGVSDTGSSIPPAPPIDCSAQEPVSTQAFASAADVQARLDGLWALCGHSGESWSALGPSTEAGIAIHGSTWNVLSTAPDGTLVEQHGFDNEGTLEIIDTSSMNGAGVYQLNFTYGGGGTVFSETLFSTSGSTMAIDNEGATNVYVRTAQTIPTLPPPSPGAHLGASGCGISETSIHTTFASIDDARAHLVGTWLDCKQTSSGEEPFSPASTTGIEFTSDGHWNYFTDGASGRVVSGASTYELIDDGGGRFQLNMAVTGGTAIVEWSASDSPVKLRIQNEGVSEATYSAL